MRMEDLKYFADFSSFHLWNKTFMKILFKISNWIYVPHIEIIPVPYSVLHNLWKNDQHLHLCHLYVYYSIQGKTCFISHLNYDYACACSLVDCVTILSCFTEKIITLKAVYCYTHHILWYPWWPCSTTLHNLIVVSNVNCYITASRLNSNCKIVL